MFLERVNPAFLTTQLFLFTLKRSFYLLRSYLTIQQIVQSKYSGKLSLQTGTTAAAAACNVTLQ